MKFLLRSDPLPATTQHYVWLDIKNNIGRARIQGRMDTRAAKAIKDRCFEIMKDRGRPTDWIIDLSLVHNIPESSTRKHFIQIDCHPLAGHIAFIPGSIALKAALNIALTISGKHDEARCFHNEDDALAWLQACAHDAPDHNTEEA